MSAVPPNPSQDDVRLDPASTGNEALIESLYGVHYRRLVRFAYLTTGGRGDPEDLAQEAFVRALKRWDPGSPPEAFWSWLQTTLLRLHLNALRRARREAAALTRLGREEHRTEDSPRLEVLEALRRLPPRQRAAAVLRYYEDLPEAEVAERLGCRLGTAKALLHQARQRLQIVMREGDD